MHKPILFCLSFYSLCIPTLAAQEHMTLTASCNFATADSLEAVYIYEPSTEALQIVERIMEMNVLPQNFIVRTADCNNALATTVNGQRYILYSTRFLENLKQEASTRWAAYSVLAHEVGHHLSNHDLEETDARIRKRYELEADKFAGGILYRLGATLEEAQAGINTFSLEGETSTHPAKRARLEAVTVGWKKAQELASEAEMSTGAAASDSEEKKLYDQALTEKVPEKAIELLDQAIELKPDFADAYLERGRRMAGINPTPNILNPFETSTSEDAVDDFTIYIQLRPKDPAGYVARGATLFNLNEEDAALEDYDQAIRLGSRDAETYWGRALVRLDQDDEEGAFKDLKTAINIKPDFADAHYYMGYILYQKWDKDDEAITEFNRALQADSMHYLALKDRAYAFKHTGRYAEAIADFNRLEKLNPEEIRWKWESYYQARGKCYQQLRKHAEALIDFNKSIKSSIVPDRSTYMFRGMSLSVLGRKDEAKKDFDWVVQSAQGMAKVRCEIGCLLIEFGLAKEGLVWLDMVLAEEPNNKEALVCKAQAK